MSRFKDGCGSDGFNVREDFPDHRTTQATPQRRDRSRQTSKVHDVTETLMAKRSETIANAQAASKYLETEPVPNIAEFFAMTNSNAGLSVITSGHSRIQHHKDRET
jgi:hypothetical protein